MLFGLLTNALGSRTVTLALTLLPLLSQAFDSSHADDWVFDHLPARLKKNANLQEFDNVLTTGKAFLKACHAFFHP